MCAIELLYIVVHTSADNAIVPNRPLEKQLTLFVQSDSVLLLALACITYKQAHTYTHVGIECH